MREPKHRPWSKAQCGTPAGYRNHLYWQTEMCEPCRIAKRDYNREAQRRRRARLAAEALEQAS